MLKRHKNNNSETNKNADLLSYLTILLIVYPVFLIILIAFNIHKWCELGNFGSLLSGTLGPFVTAITGVLLYTSIKEQRNAFIEQTKANEISILNQKFNIIVAEIYSLQNDRKDDVVFLKTLRAKIANNIQNYHNMKGSVDSIFKNTGEYHIFTNIDTIDGLDLLKLLSITERLRVCFDEAEKLKEFSEFPMSLIKRIFGIDEYNVHLNTILMMLEKRHSVVHQQLVQDFCSSMQIINCYVY